MEVTVARYFLLTAFVIAIVLDLYGHTVYERVLGHRHWVQRVCDFAYLVSLVWGSCIIMLALWSPWEPSASEVRTWLQWALPPVIAWPLIRRTYAIRKLAHIVYHGRMRAEEVLGDEDA